MQHASAFFFFFHVVIFFGGRRRKKFMQLILTGYPIFFYLAWQCHKTIFTLDDIHYPMNIIEIDDTMINTNQDPPEFPEV